MAAPPRWGRFLFGLCVHCAAQMSEPHSASREDGITLLTPVEEIPRLQARHAQELRRMGIPSVAHLVHHLPFRHEVEHAEMAIGDLAEDVICTTRGVVTDTRVTGPYGRKRFMAVICDDAGGRLKITWFNQAYLVRRIEPGMGIRVIGTPKIDGAMRKMINPRWEALQEDEPALKREEIIRPIYPASEEMPSRFIESAVREVLDRALPQIEDHLPEAVRKRLSMPTLGEAYRMFHAPRSEEEVGEARRRLVYDELLLLQLAVHMRRHRIRATLRAPVLQWSEQIDERIRGLFSFEFTDAQNEVVREVIEDLSIATPATRLVQGDVGSGKTAVAVYAMLMAVAGGHQAALMAPTELLAEQHFAGLSRLLEGSRVRVELLTGSLKQADRPMLLSEIAGGSVDVVVGTHALLTETVEFGSLGLAVIDEQHRFGVHQRAQLKERSGDPGSTPHVLVMTATPIPRTLALTVFGDLDVSTITGLPPGRTPIETSCEAPEHSARAYRALRERIERGEQGYVVVPSIETGDDSELVDLVSTLERLRTKELAGKRVEPLHGRMARAERDEVMGRFRAGEIDALVATTVIEVGIDVPNATMMVIEQADRFGLAQLHQLRGRVGRSDKASACVLICEPKTKDAELRIEAMLTAKDGFELAERDLEIRGPGEIIGARQAGAAPFRLARFPEDIELLLQARRDAAAWIQESPGLTQSGEALLYRRLMKAHAEDLGLADTA